MHFRNILLIVIVFLASGAGISATLNSSFASPQPSNDTVRYEMLFKSFKRHMSSNLDSAYFYANESFEVALRLGDSLRLVRSYHARGDMKMELGELALGIADMEKALGIAKRGKYDERISYILNNLALAYTYWRKFDVALKYNFESLTLQESRENLDGVCASLNNIGLIYLEISDYKNALPYFEKVYKLSFDLPKQNGQEVYLINIGYCYLGLIEYENAIKSFKLALSSCDGRCDPHGYIMCHQALGKGYLKTGDYSLSEKHLLNSIQLSTASNDKRHWAASLRSIAELRLVQGRSREAVTYLDVANNLIKDTDFKIEQLENLNLYSLVFQELGDYQKSFDYQTNYLNLLKEVLNGEMINNLSQITTLFSEQTNLATIENQRQVISLKEKELAQQQMIVLIVIVLVVLLLVIVVLLWRWGKLKNRINLLLDRKVRERTIELEHSYTQLERISFEQKQNLISLNSKLHSGVATLKGITEIAKKDLEDPKGLNYISKIETEAEKLNQASSKI